MPPKRRPAPRTFNNPAKAAEYAKKLAKELGAPIEGPRLRGHTPTPPVPDTWDVEDAAEEERGSLLGRTVFTELKKPTATEFPEPPLARRSTEAEYDPVTQVLRIWWRRPGRLGPYTNYYNVTPQEWDQVKNVVTSTGKYVNRVLNYKNYDYE
jgi:hypothetical protein